MKISISCAVRGNLACISSYRPMLSKLSESVLIRASGPNFHLEKNVWLQYHETSAKAALDLNASFFLILQRDHSLQ